MLKSGLVALPSNSVSWLRREVTTRPFTLVSELNWLSANTRAPLVLGASDPSDHTSELFSYLDPARRLLWFYRSVHLLIRAVLLSAFGLLGLHALRLLGFAVPSTWDQALPAIIALWALVLILRQRLRYFDVARVVDRNLNLNAQLGTAVELIQRPSWSQLARGQIGSATTRVRALSARQMIAFRWPVRDLRALAITTALLVSVNVLNNLGLLNPFAAGSASVPQSEVTDEMDPGLGTWSELSPAEMAQLQGALQGSSEVPGLVTELNELLRTQAITPEEYATRLAQVEAELRQRADESARAQAALSELANALRDTSSTRDVAEALNRGEYQRAAQALSELGTQTDQLSPQARQELSDALREAAQRTGELSPALSEQAQQAADALRSTDPQAAQQSLQSLADAINQSNQAIASQSELGQTLSELQQDGMSGDEFDQYGEQSGLGDEGSNGNVPSSNGDQAGADAQGQMSGGGDDTAQPRAGTGAGAGAGRERTTGQSDSSRGLGVDATDKTLRLQGKASSPGTSQRGEGPKDTPLTESSDGTLAVTPQNGAPRSNEAIDAYGENNYVPFDLRPIVRGFFSGDDNR